MEDTEFRQQPKEEKNVEESYIKDYFELFFKLLLFVFFVNTFLLQTYVIPSSSMENSMLIGDHLLVDKVCYSRSIGAIDGFMLPQVEFQRGMLVAFSGPSEINRGEPAKNVVKRIIALPGETVRVINNRVFIDGKLLKEPYARFEGSGGLTHFPPVYPQSWHRDFPVEYRKYLVEVNNATAFLVPGGHYFCLGDNRSRSFDSRGWGPLPENYIIGRPWRVYWSYASTGGDYMPRGIVHKIKSFFSTVANFFSHTRWERTFKKY
jgi:signal peptidase I